ncbi:MAG TPA: MarR family transcriptional regulator [Streptosporangiaceae bacterium]
MAEPSGGSAAEPRGPLMSPGFWLHHAALAWKQVFDRRLRPLDLTPTQFMLLASVGWLTATSDHPPTQQEAADHAGADRMMTSKVVQTLTERGLVTREPDARDARAKRLRLTDEGRALMRAAIRIAVDLDEELFGPSGDALRETLQGVALSARHGADH